MLRPVLRPSRLPRGAGYRLRRPWPRGRFPLSGPQFVPVSGFLATPGPGVLLVSLYVPPLSTCSAAWFLSQPSTPQAAVAFHELEASSSDKHGSVSETDTTAVLAEPVHSEHCIRYLIGY